MIFGEVLKQTTKSMVIGITIFASGMAAMFILIKYLQSGGTIFKAKPTMLQPVPPLAETAVEIKEEIAIEKPAGELYNMSFNVTDRVTELYKVNERFPWSGFDITNIGANPVFFSVNHGQFPEAPLAVGQTMNVNLRKQGAIKRVYLKCAQGQTSAVNFWVVI